MFVSVFLKDERQAVLNPSYKIDTLVEGPSNKLVCRAAHEICDKFNGKYTPVFIHAPTGCGKSHILQAIANNLTISRPELKCVYISCEQVGALGNILNELSVTADKIDALLVDDFQVIGEDTILQKSFLRLFEELYNRNAQMVIAANSSPMEMKNLSEALVSRFRWGLILGMSTPTMEMRRMLIRRIASGHELELPEEVVEFVAENVLGNIRELEGAMLKLVSFMTLLGRQADLKTVREVLDDYIIKGNTRSLTITDIQRVTCEVFHIDMEDMLSKKRSRSLVLPRHIAMFLSRTMTNASLEEIGDRFGNRDHSTVKHACEKIEQILRSDDPLSDNVKSIKQELLVTSDNNQGR